MKMKKILSLITVIAGVVVLNAQPQNASQSTIMPLPAPSYSAAAQAKAVLDAPTAVVANPYANYLDKKFVHKSTYTPFGWMGSWQYAVNYASEDSLKWDGGSVEIFPDSIVLAQRTFPGLPASTGGDSCIIERPTFSKIGYTFDPYSKAFSAMFDEQLFYEEAGNSNDKLLNYRIDSLTLYMRYRAGIYNDIVNDNPDTLRVYMMQYSAYDVANKRPGMRPGSGSADWDYVSAYYSSGEYAGVKMVTPGWQRIADPANAKGVSTRPKAIVKPMKVYDYILNTRTDTTYSELGYTGYRGRILNMAEPFEVEAGYVVSFMMEFLPGYQYDLNDTIEKKAWNIDQKKWIYDTCYFNNMEIPYCHLTANTQGYIRTLDNGEGVNSKCAEHRDIRYSYSNYASSFWSGAYVPYHYIMPMFAFKVSVGSDAIIEIKAETADTNMGKCGVVKYPTTADPMATIKAVPNTGYKFDHWNDMDTTNPRTVEVHEPTTFTGYFISTSPSGINEASVSSIAIYPNPAKDQINVRLGENGVAVATLYNLIGQAVKTTTLTEQTSTIAVDDLTAGIYMLRVSQNGKVQTQKISIAR